MHALRQDAALLACGHSVQVQMHAPAQDAVTLACGHSCRSRMPSPRNETSGRVQRAEQLKMDQ